ncbi:GNAT family N-acetyltransferase [Nocardia suismassiliense]|uniref:GNAT family N-acetyltransferase n=1 Tax=Nocardia suismassiliense TaxID=2077092 RepID=UPI001F39E502|nr:GNAT family N-acetyltransferase [Nocardia suismassiliense]
MTEDVVESARFTDAAQPVLSAEGGLLLRPWVTEDSEDVFEAYKDRSIQRWHVRSARSITEARQWIEEWNMAWRKAIRAHWAVADTTDGRVVGRVSLKHMDLVGGQAEVAYWAMPAARGRAVVPRAVEALTAWAFYDAGFHRLELTHSVHNEPSCRVADKTGFRWEGTKYSSGLHLDGWHDMHLHARISEVGSVPDGTSFSRQHVSMTD